MWVLKRFLYYNLFLVLFYVIKELTILKLNNFTS